MSQENTPTAQAGAVVQTVQGINSGGSVIVSGRDSHYHTHFHYGSTVTVIDLESVFRAIPSFRKIHQDMLAKAVPGTGMWLFKSKNFRLWLEPNGDLRILWGSGLPGAGKTVLAALVIDLLQKMAKERGGEICVGYVYFRYSDNTKMTVRGLLEILVKQVVQQRPDLLPLAQEVYAEHLEEGTQPSEAQLLGLLQHATESVAMVFALDALDEAPTEIQLDLVKKLTSLNCKIFITSRPIKTVEAQIHNAYHFPIVAQEEDLDLLINGKLDSSPFIQELLRKEPKSVREEIVASVKQKCAGMFLHASLQLDALSASLSLDDVREALQTFPSDIEDAYRQTWRRIIQQNPRHARLAQEAILWVIYAQRSMSIEELRCAVATAADTHQFMSACVVPEASLLSLCHGLVTVEEESGLVRLHHYTTKKPLQELLQEIYPHPHTLLAAVCMTHLAKRGFRDTKISSKEELVQALDQDPLLSYAHESWAFHANLSLDAEPCGNQILDFVQGCKAFPVLARAVGINLAFDLLNPLHVAAHFSLPLPLLQSSNNSAFNRPTPILGHTPLILACFQGFQVGVSALWRSSINRQNKSGWSALMAAASLGHCDILEVLLANHEVEVNLVDKRGCSALMHAASKGHEGPVKLLLARSKVQTESGDGSAVTTAANKSHSTTVRSTKVNINLVSKKGSSALMLAAFNGREDTMKLLLAHPDVKVNLVSQQGSSALMLAALNGHTGAIRLLLAHDQVQVNLVSNKGSSALMLAAFNGHEGPITVLLAHAEVRVNLVSKKGSSALMLAALNGHEGAVKLLLAHPEVDVNFVSKRGYSALMHASENGFCGIVDLLLAHPNTRIGLVNNKGLSASRLAAAKGHLSIAAKIEAHRK